MSASRGCTVLAFHAGGTTPELWAPVRAAGPDLRIVAPDLNRIATSLPRGATYAELIDRLVDEAPDEPLVFVGATVGARIALSVAARIPERVVTILLLTPTTPDETPAFLAKLAGLRRYMIEGFSEEQLAAIVPSMLYRWGRRFAAASAELERLLRESVAADALTLANICADMGEPPIQWLHRIQAPIEIVFGGADPIFEAEWAEEWRRQPQVRSVAVLPDVAHQVALEIPERIAAELRRLAVTEAARCDS